MTHAILYAGFLLLTTQTGLAEDEPAATTQQEKKLYRSYSAEGVPEFSDKPGKNAEEIKIPSLPTYTPSPVPKTILTPQKKGPPQKRKQEVYQQLIILSPSQDEVIRDNTGKLAVTFTLTPPLKTGLGHQLQFFIDGKLHEPVLMPATFDEVYQGTHTLVIRLLDGEHRILLTSNSVTFHKIRHIRKNPAK